MVLFLVLSLTFDHFSERLLLLILHVGRIAEIQFFSVFVFLDEEDEMGALDWGQDTSDAIDDIVQLDTLTLYLVLDFSELFNQTLEGFLLLPQKLLFILNLSFLFLGQIQSIFELLKPLLLFSLPLLIFSKQMFLLSRTPHHVTMESRQAQIHNLPKILIYRVNPLFTCGTDP